jgi:hypothetical protein
MSLTSAPTATHSSCTSIKLLLSYLVLTFCARNIRPLDLSNNSLLYIRRTHQHRRLLVVAKFDRRSLSEASIADGTRRIHRFGRGFRLREMETE